MTAPLSPSVAGRRLRQWLYQAHNRHVAGLIDHAAVISQVREDGQLRGRYAFMVMMSCAIATLGLLLSSPAVIIGAMLISPLMGPIVLFGFSLCILDLKAMRNSLLALGTGTVLAVGASWAIVSLSPLTQATPEILARTQPNLFDLLVAVFSGLAGGYAVIRRKGEAIVGVAIATALMPPLCVVGYGLASGSPAITAGAAFLFMTNLLAIALSVTLLAKWFGFGADQSPSHTVWQTLLIVATFGALSLPLGLALTRIAGEARVTASARATVNDFFRDDDARVTVFDVAFAGGDADTVRVEAVVLTRAYQRDADRELSAKLARRLDRPVELDLDQVLVDQDYSLEQTELLRLAETSLTGPLQAQLKSYQREDQLVAEIRAAASFKVDSVAVEDDGRSLRIFAAPSPYLELTAYMEMEAALAERYPDRVVRIVPAVRALPPVLFDVGSAGLDAAALRTIDAIVWTLSRWQVSEATVVGFASTAGEARRFDNTSLAYQRAAAVGERLAATGLAVSATGAYRAFRQEESERATGMRSFQRVDVRPGAAADAVSLDAPVADAPMGATEPPRPAGISGEGAEVPETASPPVPAGGAEDSDAGGEDGADAAADELVPGLEASGDATSPDGGMPDVSGGQAAAETAAAEARYPEAEPPPDEVTADTPLGDGERTDTDEPTDEPAARP